ncbi:MAG: GNAT family N-acetyltransferase [Methanoregula sp.]|jgi:hypothetical protein
MIKDSREIRLDDWIQLLESSNDATMYHTPEWKNFLQSTFHYKPRYLFAQNDSGKLTGMLPLFHVDGNIGGSRLCSTPFAHDCGPIGKKEVRDELIYAAIDLCKKLQLKNLEIRDSVLSGQLHEVNNFSTFILPLSKNIPDVWKRLDKGSIRWAITKSKKSNVSVDITNDTDNLKQFYELNCITKKGLGVPCHPWNFFENLFINFGERVSLYSANYDSQIIGGGIMIRFKDSVLYGYGAADPQFLKLHPYNAFIWKSIEDACIDGCKNFDFGRTSYENYGLIQFKKKWGAVEKKLYYNYYQRQPGFSNVNRNSFFYSIANRCFRMMPMQVYKSISEKIFGSLG